MLCSKCEGMERILIFFVVSKFFWKSLSFIFWNPVGLWEYKYYLWELVGIDKNINQMNECACKF